MKIAVASGKGGTGKSMVAANLAFTLAGKRDVTLTDCDVEEPNLHLFFPGTTLTRKVTVPVPVIYNSACDHCGKCGQFCQYGAITVLPDRVIFFPELCHSCGGCMLVCPKHAIIEKPERIGMYTVSAPMPGMKLIYGVLDTGSPHAVPVIRKVKEQVTEDPLVILDTAPGTSCPVVETLDGSDACILVTESTPFGLHDLALALDVVARLGIPAGVVINRSDGLDDETYRFCADRDLPVLMRIPFSRETAAIQGRGDLLCRVQPEWQEEFSRLFLAVTGLVGGDR